MKLKPGVVVHTCNPNMWEAESEGSQVRGQPQLLSEALFQNRAGDVAQRSKAPEFNSQNQNKNKNKKTPFDS